jgi:ribosomal protein S18 acetylase RimI-like enzyme
MFEMMYAPENILRQMTKEGHTYFIVRDDEKNPVGYFSIQRHDANTYLFQKIYALPEQHGKGVGRYMIEQGIAEVAALHCASFSMMLYVNRENPAVGFYRHMGFQVIDTRDYPIGNEYYMNDYIMKRDIFRE